MVTRCQSAEKCYIGGMSTETLPLPPVRQRGPVDHTIREQIVIAAHAHFTHYGYDKTTVSDLAKAIGFSKAYIYKFFDSKQAIGEAICANCLEGLLTRGRTEAAQGKSATDKLRRLFRTIVSASVELFFDDRKLYDIAAHATLEHWPACGPYMDGLNETLQAIILEGRESGEFERKTPLDETCRSIFYALRPFIDPVFLERSLDLLPDAQTEVTGLVLRSLAP